MTMKEQLKKVADISKISVERDLDNKRRELEDAIHSLEMSELELENLKQERKVFKNISELMLKHYGKIPSKIEHLWEGIDKYWDLMKEKQVIDNNRTMAQFKNNIRITEKSIFNIKNNMDGLKQAILLTKIDLKKQERGGRKK